MCVFDADPKVVGKKVGKMQVMPMDHIARVIKDEKIAIVMVAVPESSAQ